VRRRRRGTGMEVAGRMLDLTTCIAVAVRFPPYELSRRRGRQASGGLLYEKDDVPSFS
jgi:hypothetical protein